ncbi:hypothetical protein PENANT_c034G10565 [Penicillium antarcticum]|uniref:Myb-like domain-containing protein n=1 Tax=Penicillium antarcticum TaxID=416450 RepID=A0A1V6PU44_9EURO|nr:hypothetical protein PENANT_c034G10565 [Penicillium antarcticum]
MSDTSYEPDDAESESDFESRASDRRSPTPEQTINGIAQNQYDETTFDDISEEVERGLGEVLGSRAPLTGASLHLLGPYNKLLTEIKNSLDYASIKEDEEVFDVSQLGSVIWTSTEKEIFFNGLDRKGRGGIRELAAAIGTKSELEVLEYIRILHQKLEAHNSSDRQSRAAILGEFPSAAQISQRSTALLDEYADVMVLRESLTEAAAGRLQHGDNWIITESHARELVEDEDSTIRGDLRLAADMFHLRDWIRMSRNLLMNYGGSKSEDNWFALSVSPTNVTARNQMPSMTAGSAIDFYALTVSVTRRLVQSSLFFAMSRLRTMSRRGRDRASAVRTQDVRAAIEVLNMKHKTPSFVEIARQNQLVIVDDHHRRGFVPETFTYEEAEKSLTDKDYFQRRRHKKALENGENDKDDDGQNRNSEYDSGEDDSGEDDYDEHDDDEMEEDDQDLHLDRIPSQETNEPVHPPSPKSYHEHEPALDPEEEHAEMVDTSHDRHEEAHILQLMEQPIPSHLSEPIKAEDAEDKASKQIPERRTRDEIIDWRARTLYRSDWEEYGYDYPDVDAEMEMHPRKRARFNEPPSPSPLDGDMVIDDSSFFRCWWK